MDSRAWLAHLEQFGIKLGLDTIGALMGALGHPERACPVLHIAGTNGKGSVSAMAAHALTASGLVTARYTSPHLIHLEERFAVDGQPVSRVALDAALDEVRDAVRRLQSAGTLTVEPTFFEATTAAGFVLFRAAQADLAVVEVGLGGRFDATNIVAPLVTAITSVDFDHQAQLGDDPGGDCRREGRHDQAWRAGGHRAAAGRGPRGRGRHRAGAGRAGRRRECEDVDVDRQPRAADICWSPSRRRRVGTVRFDWRWPAVIRWTTPSSRCVCSRSPPRVASP